MLETKTIGNKIAEARKNSGLSQAELASQLFISSQAVGKWERGESMPDIITLNRLADILGVDLNYFSKRFQSTVAESASDETQDSAVAALTAERRAKNPTWDLSRLNLVDTDFSGLKNLSEKFSSSNMLRCQFVGSDLAGLRLRNNNVDRCNFSDSNLDRSRIQQSNLVNNQFINCSLIETELSGSYLKGCDFTGADFTGALFKSGGLEKCALVDAVWNRTSCVNTYLVDLTFEGKLNDCSFENCGFKKVTFKHSTLLNTFFKNNRKMKQVEFIDCKADKLTYAFLKNNGANLTGVTLIAE